MLLAFACRSIGKGLKGGAGEEEGIARTSVIILYGCLSCRLSLSINLLPFLPSSTVSINLQLNAKTLVSSSIHLIGLPSPSLNPLSRRTPNPFPPPRKDFLTGTAIRRHIRETRCTTYRRCVGFERPVWSSRWGKLSGWGGVGRAGRYWGC